MAADAPGAIFGVLIFGIVLGFILDDPEPAEPKVEREVKFIEKPSVPTVITRDRVEEQTVHVVEPLPETCTDLTVTGRRISTHANKLNKWSADIYSHLQRVDLAQLSDPNATVDLIQDLKDGRDKHDFQLYEVMRLNSSYAKQMDACEREINEINGDDE